MKFPTFRQWVFHVSLSLVAVWAQAVSAMTIQSVHLRTDLYSDSMISLSVLGTLSESCTEIEEARFDMGPHYLLHSEINVYLSASNSSRPCLPATMPFVEQIFVGELADGRYQVNVYVNERLKLSQELNVPQDVRFGLEKALGQHRPRTTFGPSRWQQAQQ